MVVSRSLILRINLKSGCACFRGVRSARCIVSFHPIRPALAPSFSCPRPKASKRVSEHKNTRNTNEGYIQYMCKCEDIHIWACEDIHIWAFIYSSLHMSLSWATIESHTDCATFMFYLPPLYLLSVLLSPSALCSLSCVLCSLPNSSLQLTISSSVHTRQSQETRTSLASPHSCAG